MIRTTHFKTQVFLATVSVFSHFQVTLTASAKQEMFLLSLLDVPHHDDAGSGSLRCGNAHDRERGSVCVYLPCGRSQTFQSSVP